MLLFCVCLEIIQYRLPTCLLHFNRVHVFGIECFGHSCPFFGCFKKDFDHTVICGVIQYPFVLFYFVVDTYEIETHASVFRGHGRNEFASHLQVVGSSRAMPIIAGEVPVHHVFGGCPARPYMINRGVYNATHGDFYRRLSHWFYCVIW